MMHIPKELRDEKRWVGWRYEKRGERMTKVPIDLTTGGYAKSNDPSTWTSYGDAVDKSKGMALNGLGVMLGDGLFGVDLDHVLVSGVLTAEAEDIIKTLDSYAEVSPSGEGIHILCKGALPKGRRRKGCVEMYDEKRYFTYTGNVWGKPRGIMERTVEVKALHKEIFGEQKVAVQGKSEAMDDGKLMVRIEKSKHGARFQRLYGGYWQGDYPSQSEADLALCSILCFWLKKNGAAVDQWFRRSGLMRAKWDRNAGGGLSYGQRTIETAIAGCATVYGERKGSEGAPQEKRGYTLDDEGNAQRLYDRHGKDLHYSYVNKGWMVYEGGIWQEDQTGEVHRRARDVIEELWREANASEDKALLSHGKRSRSRTGMENMIVQLRSMEGVPILPDALDRDPWLFNCLDGTVDLKSGALQPHDRKQGITKMAAVRYQSGATCEGFLRFLSEIMDGDEELVGFIQRAVGYSMSGETKEQCLFILHGQGANGKSTLLDVLGRLLGAYKMHAQSETLMERKYRSTASADVARLKGARLVTCVEPGEQAYLNESVVKQLTGGDPVTCRFLYGKEFEYKPSYKIWMATNHKPGVKGSDHGIWRRLMMIPFNRRFDGEARDKELTKKLCAEMDGILQWAIKGCLMYQRDGLKIPKAIRRATSAYRSDMDRIQQFMEDCLQGGEERIASSRLYGIYRKWAEAMGEVPISQRGFSMKLTERGIKKVQTREGRKFVGIGLAGLGERFDKVL